MSVSVQTPYKKYSAAAAATVFPTTFRVVLAGDLQVRVDAVVVTTGFTLSTLGLSAGVDVTFTTPMVGGEVVELQRIIPKSRATDYQQLGDYNASVVNADFDRVWMSVQEVGEELDRAVKVPIGSTIDPDQLIEDVLAVQVAAEAAAADADADQLAAAASAAAAAASAATTNLPALTGKTLNFLRVKADETGYEARTPAQTLADIGGAKAGADDTITALTAQVQFHGLPISQTVLSGPVDSNGYAAFGGAVGSATLTATGTLRVAAAAGGDLSYVGEIIDPEFTSPGGSGTGYLMLSVTSAGVVTESVLSLLPNSQFGGTYSTTSGQFTHNIQEKTTKVGNGATADQVYEVCIGECPHTAGVWSGTIVWYALKRQYYGEAAIPANGTAIVFSHKLGVPITPLAQFQWGFKCETADAGSGAAVGDFMPMGPIDNGVASAMGAFHGRLSSTVNGIYGSIAPANKTSGTRANVTNVANFKAVLYVSAGW